MLANPHSILGLLPTFYDSRTNLARDMLDELRVVGDEHVFNSIVRNTVKLGEAPLAGRPITSYAGSSEAARAYRELAREVIELGQGLISAPPPPDACRRNASCRRPSSSLLSSRETTHGQPACKVIPVDRIDSNPQQPRLGV